MNVDLETDGKRTVACIYPEDGSLAARAGIGCVVAEAVCRDDDHYVAIIGEGIASGRAMIALGEAMVDAWSSRSQSKVEFDARRIAQGKQPVYIKGDVGVIHDYETKTMEVILILPSGTSEAIRIPIGPAGDKFLAAMSGLGAKFSFEPKED